MRIYVSTLVGRKLEFDVEASTTIGELRVMIGDVDRIPPTGLDVMFAGRLLDDARSLCDYNVMKDSTLHLTVARPRLARTWLDHPDFDEPLTAAAVPTLRHLALRRAAVAEPLRLLSADRQRFFSTVRATADPSTASLLYAAAHTARLYADDVALLTSRQTDSRANLKRIAGELQRLQRRREVVDVAQLSGEGGRAFLVLLYQCPEHVDVYANTFWLMRFELPPEYPFKPFKVTTRGPLPHVNLPGGELSPSSAWSPRLFIDAFVERFGRVLASPSASSDLAVCPELQLNATDYRLHIASIFNQRFGCD